MASANKIITHRIDKEHQSVGIALALTGREGTTLVTHGRLSRDGAKSISPDTIFEIGSISKVVTSLLLAQLVLDGRVTLDDPAQNYMPDGIHLPTKNGRAITLFDLASHYSGLPSVPPEILKAPIENPYANYGRKELAQFLMSYQLPRAPGEAFEYSNTGVALLGLALERITGERYEDLARSRVFVPLGMTETWAVVPTSERHRFAAGYDINGDPAAHWDLGLFLPAGGWHSTARDMARFVEAASDVRKSPLSAAFSLMLARTRATDTDDVRVGLGWFVSDDKIVWHNGMTGGFSSIAAFRRDDGRGVLTLSNQASAAGVDDIGLHLLDPSRPLEEPPATVPYHPVPATLLAEYAGSYRLDADIDIEVSAQQGRLYLKVPGQGRIEFQALSDNEFTAPALGAAIRFQRDAVGKISGLTLDQHGNSIDAPRIGEHGQ